MSPTSGGGNLEEKENTCDESVFFPEQCIGEEEEKAEENSRETCFLVLKVHTGLSCWELWVSSETEWKEGLIFPFSREFTVT